jgi:hypothetical protein
MSDLHQRMKELDELRPPNLWQSIHVRSSRRQTFIQRILSYFRFISVMQVAALAVALAAIVGLGVVVSNFEGGEISTASDPSDIGDELENTDEADGGQTTEGDPAGPDGSSRSGAATGTRGPSSKAGTSPVRGGTLIGGAADTVAFTRYSEVSNIHLIGGDGSDDRRMAKGVAPSWSPDGKRIAYGTNYGGVGTRLYVMSSDGSYRREVGPSGAFPKWSPDGLRLVFNWPCSGSKGAWPADPVCWEYEAEGTQAGGCGSDCGIGVVGADGNGVQRLGTGLWPDWGPDGRIVFTDGIPTEECDYGTSYEEEQDMFASSSGRRPLCALPLWVMNADGSGRSLLPINKATAPTWSPDGKRIAYHVDTEGVFISNANGTGSTKVAPAGYTHPDWSPDGQRLVLTRKTENAWNIFVRAVDGSGEMQFTFGNRDTLPSFSPRR